MIPLLPHCKGFSTLSNFSRSLGLQLTKKHLRDLDLHHHQVTTNTDTCPCACLHPGCGSAVLQPAAMVSGKSSYLFLWSCRLLCPHCQHSARCTSSHGYVQCSPSFWSFPLVWMNKVTASAEGQVTERKVWRKIFESSVFCQEGTTFMLKVLV